MKFKKIVLVSIFLLAILAIGVASASDEVVSDDSLCEESADVDELSVNEIEEDSVIESDGGEFPEVEDDDVWETEEIYYENGSVSILVSDSYIVGEHSGFGSIHDNEGLNGSVTVSVGNDIEKTFSSGESKVKTFYFSNKTLGLDNLGYGTHHVKVTYNKNGVETPYVYEKDIKFAYPFSLTTLDEVEGSTGVSYGDTINFVVTLVGDATNKVTLTIGNKKYTVNLKKSGEYYRGDLKVSSSDISVGEYVAVAKYLGDSKYPVDQRETNVFVMPALTYHKRLSVGEKETIILKADKAFSGTAHFEKYKDGALVKLPGVYSIKGGSAIIPMPADLTKGVNDFYLVYDSDKLNVSNYIYVEVLSNSKGFSASISATKILYGKSVKVTMKAPAKSKNAKIYVDGKSYKSLILTSGKASKLISGLSVGKHKIAVKYDYGTSSKTFFSKTFYVTVTKITLTLKKVKVKKSAKKLVLTAKLKINGKIAKGKYVKFKFNKKTYKVKTNKKGIAKYTIKKKVLKKLKVGKKVKYQVSYGKKIVKRSAKVKR